MPIRARPSKAARLGALLAALLLPPALLAAPVAEKRAELRELKARIDELARDLSRREESRSHVADQLRATESAISDAGRRLRDLAAARTGVEAELAELETQQQRLARQIERQQAQLGRLLLRHYQAGDPDALHTLLAGRDPNQAARDYHFLTLLSRAKADLIDELRAAAAEKHRLAALARDKSSELARIEQQRQQEHEALLAQRKERQSVLAKISGEIRGQRQKIDTLRRDEQRLGRLIEALAKLAARPKPGPKPSAPAKPASRGARPSADPVGATGAFAALRGKLRLPVKGEVAARFGAPRADGGATWKGIFVRAAEGSEVRAVAAGRVVFADWLRGFGNLLILDHGDGFLSVYGNNESLLRQPGEDARAGEAVATVGNSGGNPESGLYFELRHQGQVFDPMKWIAQR